MDTFQDKVGGRLGGWGEGGLGKMFSSVISRTRARICERLRSPETNSKESIPPGGPVCHTVYGCRTARQNRLLGIDFWAP
jgi:hypothetical protein